MHKQKRMPQALVLAGLLCCCAGMASAKSLPRFGTFIYSNFCISPMSRDLYGARITLRRLADGDMLVYEYTDGSTHAQIAEKLTLEAKSGALRFDLHDPAGLNTAVSGELSGDGSALMLRGVLFEEANRVTTFKRVTDLAAPVRECQK